MRLNVNMNKSFLTLLLILGMTAPFLFGSKIEGPVWALEDLTSAYVSQDHITRIFDPDGFLSDEAKKSIMATMDEMKQFSSLLVVVNAISRDSKEVDNIYDFTEHFIMNIMEIQEDRYNNLMAFYSIKDREYRIRTGEKVRKLLSDADCKSASNKIKSYLKKEKYDDAFTKLFSELAFTLKYGWLITACILTFFGLFFAFMICGACVSSRRESILKKRINRIKDIARDKPDFKMFVEENCVICLENINQDDVQKFNQMKGEIIRQRAQQEYQPLRTEVREEKVDSDKDSAFIDCGHNFHYDCIKSWLAKYPKCPICRANVGTETTQQTSVDYRTFLLGVQRDHMSDWYTYDQLDYYYSNGRFQPTSSRNSSGGSGGRTYDSGTGGVTGSW